MSTQTSSRGTHHTSVEALLGALGRLAGGGAPDEPVKIRVARAPRAGGRVGPTRGSLGLAARPIDRAVCDLVADTTNEITRITVLTSSPERVEVLEALAAERGLSAVAATSPSLRRGWVKITRPGSVSG